MRVQVMLADFAQVDSSGKVHAIGLGWAQTSVPTGMVAVIALIEFEPGEALTKRTVELTLQDEAGKTVEVDLGSAPIPLRIAAEVRPNQPEGLPPGTPLTAPLAINVGAGLPLEPGRLYSWRVIIDGESRADWTARFATRAS